MSRPEGTQAPTMEQLLAAIQRVDARLDDLTHRIGPRLLTVSEAAREMGVSAATVRRRVKDGEIAHAVRRFGRSVRIDMDALRLPSAAEIRAEVAKLQSA